MRMVIDSVLHPNVTFPDGFIGLDLREFIRGNDTTDDTLGWRDLISEINSLGEGVMVYGSNLSSLVTEQIDFDVPDNTRFLLDGVTLRPVTSTSLAATGIVNIPELANRDFIVLTGNVAKGVSILPLTSIDSAMTADTATTEGSYLYIYVQRATGADVHVHIARVEAISSLNVTINPPLPFAITTSETHGVMVIPGVHRNVSIEGLTIDMAGAPNAHGLYFHYGIGCALRRIRVTDCPRSGVVLWSGMSNDIEDIRIERSGSATYADFWARAQTGSHFRNINSLRATGFGPQINNSTLCRAEGVRCFGPVNRGVKIAGSVDCSFTDLQGSNTGSTGIAVSNYTQDCDFHAPKGFGNIKAAGGANRVGFWTDAGPCTGLRIFGGDFYNNTTLDISVTGDSTATFFGTRRSTVHASSTAVFVDS